MALIRLLLPTPAPRRVRLRTSPLPLGLLLRPAPLRYLPPPPQVVPSTLVLRKRRAG